MADAQSFEAERARRSFLLACGVTARLHEAPQNRFRRTEPAADEGGVTPDAALVGADPDAAMADPAGPSAAVEDGAGPAARHRLPSPLVRPLAEAPAPAAAVDHADPEAADAIMAARTAARTATTLDTLRATLAAFEGCALRATANTTCVGEGPEGADIMVVGEAPGREEDAAGRPFVGRSGKLLDAMLGAIGYPRETVYVTNVIPWRPPGNRPPTSVETATCEVFVRREIALVRPRVLVLLGGPAAKTLLATDLGITRQRGRWTTFRDDEGREVSTLATFHPAYLLRQPFEKKKAWADLLAVARALRS